MNYKLEKFWNTSTICFNNSSVTMNYKLEKFWNSLELARKYKEYKWTINLKSFEIYI